MITVNDNNVQNLNMEEFKELFQNNSAEVTLKLRRVRKYYETLEMSGNKAIYQEWGMQLGIFITHIKSNSYAHNQGLCEFDEILQVSTSYMLRIFLF